MSNLEIVKCEENDLLPEICNLEYGTFVTNVPSGNDCVYVKVKKRSKKGCKGVGLEWDSGNCVLFNLKYGTLRQIPARTKVTPLVPTLHVREVNPKCYNTVIKGYNPNC